MRKSLLTGVIIFCLLLAVVFILMRSKPMVPAKPTVAVPPRVGFVTVHLYFIGADYECLVEKEVQIPKGELVDMMKEALRRLGEAPAGTGLYSAIPPYDICFRDVWVEGDRAYVDLHKGMPSADFTRGYFMGSTGETLGVYSIVNTLTKSFPRIKNVQILVGGKKAVTITGHMDISEPLEFDSSVVKSGLKK